MLFRSVALRADVIDVVVGVVMLIHQAGGPNSSVWGSVGHSFFRIYISVAVSVNVLLTLMIVTRLVLHSRSIRAAMGTPGGIGGLYKTVITMLIDSCALFTVSSLLVIEQSSSGVVDIFFPILAETQVRVSPRS